MVQQVGGKKRRLKTKHRQVGTNGHRFETTAQAIALPQKAKWQRPEPSAQIAEPIGQTPLAPGEERKSKTYRARSLADIWPPLVWSLVSGGLVGVAGGFVCLAFDWEWFWGIAIWWAATGIAWFVSSKDLLDDDKLITAVQEMVRAPEPQPTIVQPQPVNLEFYDREKKQVDRVELRSPISNAQGLAEYADALIRGTAMPSMDGGKETHGARSCGYTEPEFEQWRREAVRAHLLASKGKGQGYEITPRGRRSFKHIARLELESMSYGV